MGQELVENLKTKLKDMIVDFARPRHNRIYLFVEPEHIRDVARVLFENMNLRFSIASGIDRREGVEIIYHFFADKEKIMVNIKTIVPKPELMIDTISDIIWGALWIEREIHELFGVNFVGHPNLEHLILPDDWEEGYYPYRREYKKEDQGFKGEIKG